ncbi:MAG TPA: NAD(P)-dependent oxidoreductase [Bryobacteraceae bacterium]|jgi:3-hydroxyisobutyrate dehydrogenase-like beta-hydroxyacid dehydrogenase|nr:NAD(P)-dependent oxidoreductase [Bryobacteraceae bacterium]
MRVGFIGLGKMGTGMARNLLAAGHEVAVWNRSPEKARALEGNGARVASTPAEACYGAEAVLTMLADDQAVHDVVFWANGIADSLGRGAIHISCSTISTELARTLAAEHAGRGHGYLSVPVFGRPEAAANAKLLVIAAGQKEIIDYCQPLFNAIGRQTIVAGSEPWQANLVKICGNFTIASAIETLSETFAAIKKSGVDPQVFLGAMNELYNSPVYKGYGQAVMESKTGPGGFALRLGLKDVRLMLKAADECSAPMPVASVIRDNMLSGIANGQGDFDWSSLALVAARNAGIKA